MSFDEFEDIQKKIQQNDPSVIASQWAKDAISGMRKTVTLDDEIPFDGAKCLTDCGGKCCTDIDVAIKPYDIYRIVTSPEGKALGFTDTTRLFGSFLRTPGVFECYLGNTSGVPSACIRFTTLPNGIRTRSSHPSKLPDLNKTSRN